MNLLALANCLFGLWLFQSRSYRAMWHPDWRLKFLYSLKSIVGLVFAYAYFNVAFLGWGPDQISLYIRPAITILLGCLIGTSFILDGSPYGRFKSGHDS